MELSPQFVERSPVRYAAIRMHTKREEIGKSVEDIFAEISGWLSENAIKIVSAPIIRYFSIDHNKGDLDIDVGFQVSDEIIPMHPRIKINDLPGGRYLTANHKGGYENLVDTTATLLAWGDQNRINWQKKQEGALMLWESRFENYLIGPTETPKKDEWITEIWILIKE
jgi:effector-binding domain-containing protein